MDKQREQDLRVGLINSPPLVIPGNVVREQPEVSRSGSFKLPDFSISRRRLYLFFLFHKIFFYGQHKESMSQWMEHAIYITPDSISWNVAKKRYVLEWNFDSCMHHKDSGKVYSIPTFLQ